MTMFIFSHEVILFRLKASVAMKQFREIVIKKYKESLTGAEIFKHLQNTGISRAFVYKAIKRFNETGTNKDRKRTGRLRSVRTPKAVKVVRKRIRRNPERSGT